MPTPNKNLNNNDVINVDNSETFRIPNGTTLKKKDNHIASVPEKKFLKNTQSNNSNSNNKFADESKSVIILRDSMIKHLKGWELSKKVSNPVCKIYVKHYATLFKKCTKPLHSSCWH